MTENELIRKALEFHKEFEVLQKEADSELPLDFYNITNHIFENRGSDVSWNEDNSKKDLEYGDGRTYCVEVNYVIYEDNEFLLVDADDQQGNRHSNYLFSKEKEIKYE